MRDIELECLPNWRFCRIERGQKGPRYPGWQTNPVPLDQIPQDMNVGVVSGPLSGGILNVDFDGPWAWEYWQENIKIDFAEIDTVSWSSGKSGRCQMAFRVPEEAWELLVPRISISGPARGPGEKPDGLEFRWSNHQSVLPPSLHPENVNNPDIYYRWLRNPSSCDVQEIPYALLEWIVHYRPAEKFTEQAELPPVDLSQVTNKQYDHLVALLEQLRGLYGRPDQPQWLKWSFAAASVVGPAAAAEVMNSIWPEEKRGEYRRLLKTWNRSRSPGLSTLEQAVRERVAPVKKIILNNNVY